MNGLLQLKMIEENAFHQILQNCGNILWRRSPHPFDSNLQERWKVNKQFSSVFPQVSPFFFCFFFFWNCQIRKIYKKMSFFLTLFWVVWVWLVFRVEIVHQGTQSWSVMAELHWIELERIESSWIELKPPLPALHFIRW